jgi:hypothetical protein
LRLAPPNSDRASVVALAAVPLLLGLAATGPALRTHVGRRVRTDTQAIFVFDTSRSMAASNGPHAPTRFAQAQAAALELRNQAIADVPSGVSSLTTLLLPLLFPTPNTAAFDSTVESAVGIEKPPPPFFQSGVTGTSFAAIDSLRNQGFFNPTITHRFAILLTDGESGPIGTSAVGQALEQSATAAQSYGNGRLAQKLESPVVLFIVRVGGTRDRIYHADGSIEAAYRPDPQAPVIVSTLAAAAGGRAFTIANLSAAEAALRQAVSAEHTSLRGVNTKTTTLAPYVVLAAFAPLILIIRRRNLTNI